MASSDDRDIKSFLKENGLPEDAIKAVEDYGLKTYADFVCMTEKEFDDLKAKGFEKERLKKEWRKQKDREAAGSGNLQYNYDNSRGNIQTSGSIQNVNIGNDEPGSLR